MDIIGVINRVYRSYGTLFSDDFIAFLKENSQNHVSKKNFSNLNIDFLRKSKK